MLSSLVAGCPSVVGVVAATQYPRDVHQPRWTGPSSCEGLACPVVGECVTLAPTVLWETMRGPAVSTRPRAVRNLTASCIAPTCHATVSGDTVIVSSESEGTARVRLNYEHPVTNEHVEQDLDLVFRADTANPLVPRPRRAQYACPRPAEGAHASE